MTAPVRKPIRLTGYDYANCGVYFITVCVQHMDWRFGVVEGGRVCLNEAGMMVSDTWEANVTRYPGVALDAYVVMPNHLHAIVFLGGDPAVPVSDVTLSRVVQSFKSRSTVEYTRGVHAGRYPPYDRVLWQRSFYDKILRNDRALQAARAYIEGNPGRMQARLDANRTTPV